MEDDRAATARAETEASAIFSKYAGDVDTMRRIDEIRQAIRAETNEVPKESGPPEFGSTEFKMLLQTLNQLQESANPQQSLDRYTAYLADQHRLRMELLAPPKD